MLLPLLFSRFLWLCCQRIALFSLTDWISSLTYNSCFHDPRFRFLSHRYMPLLQANKTLILSPRLAKYHLGFTPWFLPGLRLNLLKTKHQTHNIESNKEASQHHWLNKPWHVPLGMEDVVTIRLLSVRDARCQSLVVPKHNQCPSSPCSCIHYEPYLACFCDLDDPLSDEKGYSNETIFVIIWFYRRVLSSNL